MVHGIAVVQDYLRERILKVLVVNKNEYVQGRSYSSS
jgi:hypothetical protein